MLSSLMGSNFVVIEEAGTYHAIHHGGQVRHRDSCCKENHLASSPHQQDVPATQITDHSLFRQLVHYCIDKGQ